MNSSRDTDLTRGNIYKALLRFTAPILISNLLQQLYNVADSAIVGQILGEDALAAVGASYQISYIILAISMGMTIGISILISEMYGAGNLKSIQSAVDTGMILSFILSLIITVVGILFARPFLHVCQIPKNIFDQAVSYFTIICIGTVTSFGYNAVTNDLRGIGDSETPLYFLLASSIMNIILDFTFILGFHMGVSGAALSTILSEAAAFLGITCYVNHTKLPFKIHIKGLLFDSNLLKKGLKIGIPATLQQFFIGLGNIVIQALVNSYGSIYIAAFTAASKLEGFAALPAANFGKSISNFIAQNRGAKLNQRMKQGMIAGSIIISMISVFFTIVILLFSRPLMHLFCFNENVCLVGVQYFQIVSLFYVIYGLMQLLNGILLGIEKANYSLAGSILSFCAFQVPIAIILSKVIGISGIWIAAPFGWLAGLILRIIFLIRSH